MERYENWVCSVGALRPYKSPLSLVSRLQTTTSVKTSMLRTLACLLKSIHRATEIAAGSLPNRVAGPVTISDADRLKYGFSSSDSDSSTEEEEDPDHRNNILPELSEIRELISSIDARLSYLEKISHSIPNPWPTAEERRLQAAKTEPVDSRTDVMHINDKYPKLEQTNAALAMRLGNANVNRRQYFRYCRDNSECECSSTENGKSETHRFSERSEEQPKLGMDAGPEKSTLTGTKQKLPEIKYPLFMVDTISSSSDSSSITSAREISDDELPFPPVPVEARTGSSFLCPYCFTFQRLEHQNLDREWRMHVLQDLRPYDCTFPLCRVDSFRSRRDWSNHELMKHRNEWFCRKCSLPFESPDGLKAHITQTHPGLYKDQDVPAIVDHWKLCVCSIRPDAWPFCEDESWAEPDPSHQAAEQAPKDNLSRFQRHVGHHLLQIALFALPRSAQS